MKYDLSIASDLNRLVLCFKSFLLAPYFHTVLHYVKDHLHTINLMYSISYKNYHRQLKYDQGLMTIKLKIF